MGCLKIIKTSRQKQSPQAPDAGLIIAVSPRREGPNPRLSCTKARGSKSASQQHQDARIETRVSASRREGLNPRLSIKARGSEPASQQLRGARVRTNVSASRREGRNLRLGYNCPGYGAGHRPHNGEVNPSLWSVFRGARSPLKPL